MTCLADHHKFIYYKSESYKKEFGYRGMTYVSIDYFFCMACGHTIEKKREITCDPSEIENRPDWAKVITNKIY